MHAEYTAVAFSDHLAHTVKIKMPEPLMRMCCPRTRPLFKVREEVVRDKQFQESLQHAMSEWENVRREGLPVLSWWEIIVKPGIRKLAMERSKEINQDRRSFLNLLLLRQAYLVKKIQHSQPHTWSWSMFMTDLLTVSCRYKPGISRLQKKSNINQE